MTWRTWLDNPKTWEGGWHPGLECNSGGPRSRTRTETLRATVLGASNGCIRSPLVRRLGLSFNDADPVATAWDMLTSEGFRDPEDLRHVFRLPTAPLICRADPSLEPVEVYSCKRRDVLEDLLWLGLCTAWLFDPSRPVLWTRASLTRRLEVFEGEGFYA